jgi:hypothetical protein
LDKYRKKVEINIFGDIENTVYLLNPNNLNQSIEFRACA